MYKITILHYYEQQVLFDYLLSVDNSAMYYRNDYE